MFTVRLLDRLLNLAGTLFPTIAILILLNASEAWFGALAFILTLKFFVTRQLQASEREAMGAFMEAIQSGRATVTKIEVPSERAADDNSKAGD